MICLLLFILPLLITSEEYDSRISKEGNPIAGRLNFSMQQGRSIGGIETKSHAWPWMAQLAFFGRHSCGGSLIDRSFVVTAAHCVRDRLRHLKYFTVYIGGHTSLSGQAHKVLNISVHPLYNKVAVHSQPQLSMTFNETFQPISLPLLPPRDNQMCVVAGWGVTESDGYSSEILREIRVPIIPAYECNSLYYYAGGVHIPSVVCARKEGGFGSCFGDSGGPLMCERAGKWELQGVASWVAGDAFGRCALANRPDVYARVLPAISFLKVSMFLLR